ncbi:putative uncharacterized protein [Prevotella sp. CAG:924]|nr:putative uncharacterized protein [Prevotella sp. CAG:924]
MDQYVTITNTIGEGFYTEKRSKFLAFAHHVETIDEAKAVVAHYKAKYYDARHCCFAYVLGPERDTYRAFDDGEPSSTAGRPILGQINSFEVTDIIIVVVRYYGGVNLGTGRLTQAYKLAAQDAMNHTKREVRTIEEKIVYQFAYANFSAVMRVVHDMQARIINQDFGDKCSVRLAVPRSHAEELNQRLHELDYLNDTKGQQKETKDLEGRDNG